MDFSILKIEDMKPGTTCVQSTRLKLSVGTC